MPHFGVHSFKMCLSDNIYWRVLEAILGILQGIMGIFVGTSKLHGHQTRNVHFCQIWKTRNNNFWQHQQKFSFVEELIGHDKPNFFPVPMLKWQPRSQGYLSRNNNLIITYNLITTTCAAAHCSCYGVLCVSTDAYSRWPGLRIIFECRVHIQ